MGKVTTIPPSRGPSFGRPGLGHHLRRAAAFAVATLADRRRSGFCPAGAGDRRARKCRRHRLLGDRAQPGAGRRRPLRLPVDRSQRSVGPGPRPLHPRPARPGIAGRQAVHRHRVAGRPGLRRGARQFAAAEHLPRGDLRLWHFDLRPRPERGGQAHPHRRRRRAVPARPVRSAGTGWRTGLDLARRRRDRRGHALRDHRFGSPGRGFARRSRLRPAHAAALRRRSRHRHHPSPVA